MSPIRVVVHGATGRMGQEVLGALCREPDMEPVGAVCRRRNGVLNLPKDSATIPLSTDIGTLLGTAKPQVVVDFTNAEACMKAARECLRREVAFVTGTSGLSEENVKELDRLCREQSVGAIVAPNFALGAVVLMHLAQQAAPYFDYVDIIEAHHEKKIDSPSGTALAMARAIAQNKEFQRPQPEKEPLAGTRGGAYKGVGIHSLRMPGRSAHHEVIFATTGQTLSLRHDTLGRDCYMPGVMRAIREVVNLKSLVVGLDKLLGL